MFIVQATDYSLFEISPRLQQAWPSTLALARRFSNAGEHKTAVRPLASTTTFERHAAERAGSFRNATLVDGLRRW